MVFNVRRMQLRSTGAVLRPLPPPLLYHYAMHRKHPPDIAVLSCQGIRPWHDYTATSGELSPGGVEPWRAGQGLTGPGGGSPRGFIAGRRRAPAVAAVQRPQHDGRTVHLGWSAS